MKILKKRKIMCNIKLTRSGAYYLQITDNYPEISMKLLSMFNITSLKIYTSLRIIGH